MDINKISDSLRKGSKILAGQTAAQKNIALSAVIESIKNNKSKILEANKIDVENSRNKGVSESLIDRLSLDDKKINGIIESIQAIIQQTDPIGEELAGWKTPNGMQIRQVRVPIGVIAIIYESRPNVTADASSFDILSKCEISLGRQNSVFQANEDDFGNEYLDYEICIKTVENLNQAIEYINSHNTKHSESIITNNRAKARKFQNEIDASCVYVNCSTRFTDGGEFGFGTELGISTQKLHARGPMGIKALTTTKYLIDGEGQIR